VRVKKLFLFHCSLKTLGSKLTVSGADFYANADALQLVASQECRSATYEWVKDDIANETEQFDTPSGKFQREGCWMTNAAALFTTESPNAIRPLHKFVSRYIGNALTLLFPSLFEHHENHFNECDDERCGSAHP
jgi:hypothetical protein